MLPVFLVNTACVDFRSVKSISLTEEIFLNQGNYVGERVSVRGYLSFGDDRKALWISRELYESVSSGDVISEEQDIGKCISIMVSKNSSYYKLRGIDKSYVTLSGVLSSHDISSGINLGYCSNFFLIDPEISK